MRTMGRRTFLRGAGGAAIALPFLEAMVPLSISSGTARAATVAPKRLVTMFSGNGWVMDNWRCKATTPTDFTLSQILKPFESIRDRCIFIEGVPNLGAYEGSGGGHPGGNTSIFTGSWVGPGNEYAGGTNRTGGPPLAPSIEHRLGQEIGKASKYPSYHLGVVSSPARIMSRVFYAGNGTAQASYVNPNFDPYNVYEQLFAGLSKPGTVADVGETKRTARRRTVLNDVMEDLRSLRCKLGAGDRLKLEQHLTNIADLDARLGLSGPVQVSAQCQAPVLDQTKRIDTTVYANMPALSRIQLDLLAMALACDMTRCAGFQWHRSDTDNNAVMTWLNHDDSHHDISHLRGANPIENLTSGCVWFANEIMYLVNKLKAMSEGTGSVFDNTVILWCTEQGNGWEHRYTDIPFNIIGTGGHFKGGRYLKYAGNATVPHHRLLLSLMEYMGSTATTVGGAGAAKFCTGGPLHDLT